MRFECFEEIIAWQKARDLAVAVYHLFKESRDFAFRNQIQRAAISISSNIAEGFERKTNEEFKYFLYIAKGSCAELRSLLHMSVDLKMIPQEVSQCHIQDATEVSKILSGLIKTL